VGGYFLLVGICVLESTTKINAVPNDFSWPKSWRDGKLLMKIGGELSLIGVQTVKLGGVCGVSSVEC
jgi:hypothetical protein